MTERSWDLFGKVGGGVYVYVSAEGRAGSLRGKRGDFGVVSGLSPLNLGEGRPCLARKYCHLPSHFRCCKYSVRTGRGGKLQFSPFSLFVCLREMPMNDPSFL